MYIITGGAGFIGSAIARKLNFEGIDHITIIDELGSTDKWRNLRNIKYFDYIHKDKFIEQIRKKELSKAPTAIIHMGACSSTTERDADYMMSNNYEYTKELADYSVQNGVRFIYASSAATYGAGENGYSDDEDLLEKLSPLNVYGYSKHIFDLYAKRKKLLSKIVGLKFFNVFGPNEYHKEEMRSVVLKSFYQINETGKVKLFKSYRPEFKDGEQKRDFIYVKDCADIIWQLLSNHSVNGIFNLGSGKARSWNDLVSAVFKSMSESFNVEYIDMPESIRGQYQYFTEACMSKLNNCLRYSKFPELESRIEQYIKDYLLNDKMFI